MTGELAGCSRAQDRPRPLRLPLHEQSAVLGTFLRQIDAAASTQSEPRKRTSANDRASAEAGLAAGDP
jgi:hypothetical protein